MGGIHHSSVNQGKILKSHGIEWVKEPIRLLLSELNQAGNCPEHIVLSLENWAELFPCTLLLWYICQFEHN